jgi:hypothetical protein
MLLSQKLAVAQFRLIQEYWQAPSENRREMVLGLSKNIDNYLYLYGQSVIIAIRKCFFDYRCKRLISIMVVWCTILETCFYYNFTR